MKTSSSDKTESRWQKTPVANLVRHIQSGSYYARIRVRGKLIWKSLKTDRISVAKLRLGDFHKEERQRAAAHTAVARGKMTLGAALETYRERLNASRCASKDWHSAIAGLCTSFIGRRVMKIAARLPRRGSSGAA
jgi:hypothetical protein